MLNMTCCTKFTKIGSDSIPSLAPFKEALVRVFFLCADEDENPFEGSSEERAECEVLLQRVGNSEAKHVDTFNASDSRQSHQAPHLHEPRKRLFL